MFTFKHISIGIVYCVLATLVVVNVVDLSWMLPPSMEYLTPLDDSNRSIAAPTQ